MCPAGSPDQGGDHDLVAGRAELPESRTPTEGDRARLSAHWRHKLDERIALTERLRDQLTGCIGCGCLSLQRCRLINPSDRLAGRGAGARMITNPPPGAA
nr:MerR family DNA-binding protein [Actinoplanes toevensis]